MKESDPGPERITRADRASTAAIIAEAVHELEQLADAAGLELLARLLGLVKTEAELKMKQNEPGGAAER